MPEVNDFSLTRRSFLQAASAAGAALASGAAYPQTAPAGRERTCSRFRNTRRML
ncbi:MAG: twin-arginine translocation signal domain-containing protein, partial [Candidatus Latescibacterota bacterium]